MGKPSGSHVPLTFTEFIGDCGERTGKSPNRADSSVRGCRAGMTDSRVTRRSEQESSAREGDSPVFESESDGSGT